jgi:hypothetical protein
MKVSNNLFAFIAEKRKNDVLGWETQVNHFILGKNEGAKILPDKFSAGNNVCGPDGSLWYPVGSVRWQWEEEDYAKTLLT